MRNRSLRAAERLAVLACLAGCGGTTFVSESDASTLDGGASDAGNSDAGKPDGGNAACNPACGTARLCCAAGGGASACVNPDNDPLNCGGCGAKCAVGSYCSGGVCQSIPCDVDGGACPSSGAMCCGISCCNMGDICCQDEGPVGQLEPSCFTPTADQKTCPQGCAPLCVSDRDQKHALAPVDEQKILESVSRMPITTWSYNSDKAAVRHIGPMAQDFHAEFGLGATDRAYDPIDAHGVAFAAIKALNQKIDQQNMRIERLEEENRTLRNNGGAAETNVCRF